MIPIFTVLVKCPNPQVLLFCAFDAYFCCLYFFMIFWKKCLSTYGCIDVELKHWDLSDLLKVIQRFYFK